MSKKSNIPSIANLEEIISQVNYTVDFGDEEVNEYYKKMPKSAKKTIDDFNDPKEKTQFLKRVIQDKKQKQEKQKEEKKEEEKKTRVVFKPTTPDSPPPLSVKFQPVSPDFPPPPSSERKNEVPEELFEKDFEELEEEPKKGDVNANQAKFENLIDLYMKSNPYIATRRQQNNELEVRFGTRGIKRITKNDYDNVIQKLKSLGFTSANENGEYRLSIQNEYVNTYTGKFQMSNIRTEIHGISAIQSYCKNNNITELQKLMPMSIKFTKKSPAVDNNNNKLYPVNFDDFNFRVSYQLEFDAPKAKEFIIQNWSKNKKTFRYINRVTFSHPDYPVMVDISISKQSGKNEKYYSVSDSGVFTNPEMYEIELEVNNRLIGPATKFKTNNIIMESLRKVIKFVLCGLQGTNFPVSYSEQRNVLNSYMRLLHKDDFNPHKYIHAGNFLGPSSFTLQMENIAAVNENSTEPNIRNQFTVTDKADGDRHLLFINTDGKIYLINTNMDVIFTGTLTKNEKVFGSLLDGELIYHDKKGKFINLYAAFDIYYFNKQDVRALPFMPMLEKGIKTDKTDKCRYLFLKKMIQQMEAVSVLQLNKKTDKVADVVLPITYTHKRFYPENIEKGDIFNACYGIIQKVENNLFEYTTDGLIFTPAFLGVGSDTIGKAGPLSKITWNYSFKWKPPQYNTIDFLISTIKTPTGTDVVKSIFEDGMNMNLVNQVCEYKTIQLLCTYSEKKHGTIYLNPCQDIIDDNLPEYKVVNYEDKNTNDAVPMQFYPIKPYDPTAGICNIMLRKDDNNISQMFTEENEVFGDNTIVEFSYNFINEHGWRWSPLRVRYDKTAEMLQGAKNFGNAYHVATNNWKSIHNPITEEMITTGLNIPDMSVSDDVYYNKNTNDFKTQHMKDFHNLYVKKMLIKKTSRKGDTLIDYACGKAGDLSKWVDAHLSFVFGIDISKDNLENRLDGACVRYLETRKRKKNMPHALFVNGNSAYNIKNGAAMLNDKAGQITKAIFGSGPKDESTIGKGVARQYGKGENGFNVSSCQFAIHYFFENPESLQGFMRNLSECTKIGGYFIGTCYDGKSVFQMLKKKKAGESILITEDGKKIWEVSKSYSTDVFEDDSSSIGYKINVYQESINNTIPEYLVNFDYLVRVMEDYGFKLLDRDECKDLELPDSSGLFSELFSDMLEEIKKNKYKLNDYGTANQMSPFEKKISFLNRYFVFKKIRNVNTEKLQLELGEYNEVERDINVRESIEAVNVAKKTVATLPKIRKLNKKMLLIPATEAVEEEPREEAKEEPKEQEHTKKTKKEAKSSKPKPVLIIEGDTDED